MYCTRYRGCYVVEKCMIRVIMLTLSSIDCLAYTSTTIEQINKVSAVLAWDILGLSDNV